MTDEEIQVITGVKKVMTEIDGGLEFKDVPYDVYTIEIKETNEYKSLKKVKLFLNIKENYKVYQISQKNFLPNSCL